MDEFFYQMTAYIHSGGVVMVPILCISLVMWVLIFNRLFFLHRLYVKNMPRDMAGELIWNNQWPEKKYKGANAFLVRAFLSRRGPVPDPDLDAHILDETVMALTAALDQHLALIGVLSAVAPLMGLLGTVVGMMETFDVITVFGTGNVRAMASGISVALVTTQTGLMISIPGLYMSGWLNRRASNLKHHIASTAMYLKPFIPSRSVSC